MRLCPVCGVCMCRTQHMRKVRDKMAFRCGTLASLTLTGSVYYICTPKCQRIMRIPGHSIHMNGDHPAHAKHVIINLRSVRAWLGRPQAYQIWYEVWSPRVNIANCVGVSCKPINQHEMMYNWWKINMYFHTSEKVSLVILVRMDAPLPNIFK